MGTGLRQFLTVTGAFLGVAWAALTPFVAGYDLGDLVGFWKFYGSLSSIERIPFGVVLLIIFTFLIAPCVVSIMLLLKELLPDFAVLTKFGEETGEKKEGLWAAITIITSWVIPPFYQGCHAFVTERAHGLEPLSQSHVVFIDALRYVLALSAAEALLTFNARDIYSIVSKRAAMFEMFHVGLDLHTVLYFLIYHVSLLLCAVAMSIKVVSKLLAEDDTIGLILFAIVPVIPAFFYHVGLRKRKKTGEAFATQSNSKTDDDKTDWLDGRKSKRRSKRRRSNKSLH